MGESDGLQQHTQLSKRSLTEVRDIRDFFMRISNLKKDQCHICNSKLKFQYHGLRMVKYCTKSHLTAIYTTPDYAVPVLEWDLDHVDFKYRLGRKLYGFAFYTDPKHEFFMSIRRRGVLITSMFKDDYLKKISGKSDKELQELVEVYETFT